jgi:hypothetical protein
MHVAKLSLILPVTQVAAAVAMLEWAAHTARPFPPHGDELYVPTTRMVCMGINAPAGLFALLAQAIPMPDITAFRLYTSDFIFLAWVAIIWHLAGRALDRQISQGTSKRAAGISVILWNVFLLVLGVCLFLVALSPLHWPTRYNNPTGNIVSGMLFLAWSLILIAYSGLHLIQTARRKTVLTRIS